VTDRFLALDEASVAYGSGGSRCQALAGVSIGFEPQRLTLVQGPSGSGKTTLLALLGCLMRPDKGAVWVDGKDVTRMREPKRCKVRRQSIGFVFQAFRLFRALPALDNVAIAGEVAGLWSRKRAKQLLDELGLGHKLGQKPHELSGGEKQRVAIARALLRNPPIVLADEPTASLDSKSGQQIAEILRDLAERQQRTVVVVSHDPRWEVLAHRTVVLRDGQIVNQGEKPI
jgi:putative ABC transport system ATP-binding protein